MNAELEKWLDEHEYQPDHFLGTVVRLKDLRALFDGKVLIDANKDASCEAAMEHELSAMQATVSSFKSPGEALRALIDWHCAVAIDPKVNGGKVLLPVDEITPKMWSAGRNEFCRIYDRVRYAMHSEIESAEIDAAPQSMMSAMLAASQEQGK